MLNKKILGLDLGTTSIGWAFVKESDDLTIPSTIERLGVRVNPLTTDEQINFERGKPVSENADRTLKRGARRNLQRYKQRRKNLIDALIKNNIITNDTILAENDKQTTHITYQIRAKAASEEISKEQFAKVLLMINKKRGYKSSRKAKNEDEGQAIDGMAVAKRLYEENLTPGQLSYQLLSEGKKTLPDYYRSDLQNEFNKVWDFQKQFYPEIFTDEFKKEIEGKGQRATAAIFWTKYKFNTADIKGTREEKKLKAYEWRSKAIDTQLSKEEAAYVITEINNNINGSSGYLGAISDRSKELYFNKQTVGKYLYEQLKNNPHTKLKNQVFYRQDYFDEFEKIWETQSKFHKELTPDFKTEIRDIIIFYQRKLKSQKGLISFCEFESKKIETIVDGKKITKTIGYKVAPKSSPLFQEFKIWQNLNSLLLQNKETKEIFYLEQETKQMLFDELNIKGNLSKEQILKLLDFNSKDFDLNFSVVEGNRTNLSLYDACLKILELEGYGIIDWEGYLSIKKETRKTIFDFFEFTKLVEQFLLGEEVADFKNYSGRDIKDILSSIFKSLNINIDFLNFNAELDGKAFEQQPAYQLWHLLYSAEDETKKYDDSEMLIYGKDNIGLKKNLCEKFGFKPNHAKTLSNVLFQDDYGSLSAKAIRKIFPFIKENNFYDAKKLAGYNEKELKKRDKLELLPKNSLRNPVVEKILNQMVNLVNALIDTYSEKDKNGNIINYFAFDEIRIELARELKKNADERAKMTTDINSATLLHEKIRQKITIDFPHIKNPSRNDVIRYKLYEELIFNAYKNIYTNEKIDYEDLFSKRYDIDHIIPQQSLFDDSFSNKTLVPRQVNLDKGNRTAYDFILSKYGQEALEQYEQRVQSLFDFHSKEKTNSKAKYKKLLMKAEEIGKGFIERDLRDSQYIAKKAKQILQELCKLVVSTTGSVTDRLREDWDLINIMQELNFDKYKKLGLTEMVEKKDGSFKERIIDWTKRNDHRHHAMDALTVAFTKHSHIQYLNNLNARKKEDKLGREIYGIEQKETHYAKDDEGNGRRKFNMPMPNFRTEAKKHLENILVSQKAKNKVATKNKNKFKTKAGEKSKIELTPRGQLHKETVYGKLKQYTTKEEKVGAKFDEITISKVASPKQRAALLQRLQENNSDPKKAFTGKNSLDKNPIYSDANNTVKLPEKVKLVAFENDYTIRKDVTPENFKDVKNIEKIIDVGIKNAMLNRLKENNNNSKEAFSNLDKNPIWLNKEKGIAIKRVTISGVKNAEPLHFKKDHLGKLILDENENKIAVDFVSTGNNHHVAIYRDADGNLQDNVVSFYEVVERVNQQQPVIDKTFNSDLGWQFLFTMKQNEYFIFPAEGFDPSEIDLLNPANNKFISPNLFRVQKFSKLIYGNSAVREYVFRHHLETSVDDKKELKETAFKNIKSLSFFEKIIKVRINHIGEIVKVGEY